MIRIVTDTVAGLPDEIIQQYQIPVIAQYVVFGEESFREYFDISAAEFYTRQAASVELPQTSAPSPGDFEVVFEAILKEDPAAQILCIHPSSDVSGTIRSARPAAAMFPDADIRIFDTRSASLGQGLMVLEAAQMVAAGKSIEAVVERLAEMRDDMQVRFAVNTLEYLLRGGRIGRAAHLMASVLEIKPVLAFIDGVVESHSKFRTHKRAVAAIADMVIDSARGQPGLHLAVIHGSAPAEANALADRLCAELHPAVFMIGELGPAIGVHVGPGVVGACWFVPATGS